MPSARRTGSNEQIRTYGGVTRDHDTGEGGTWEALTDTDHVADTESDVLEIYNDQVHADNFNLASSTNNSSFLRIIRAAAGEKGDGTPNSGAEFLTTAAQNIFQFAETDSMVQDLLAAHNMDSNNTRRVIQIRNTGTRVQAIGIFSFDSANAGTGTSLGMELDADDALIALSLMHNNDGSYGFSIGTGSGLTGRAYNNKAIDCATGFEETSTGTNIVKNCLGDGNTTDFGTGFAAGAGESENNSSGDGSAPGSNSRINQTFTFVNAGADDFHLAAGDGGARDFGIDLSADAAFDFNDDFDGDLFNVWDIGFDENNPAATGLDPSLEFKRVIDKHTNILLRL